MTTFRPNRRAPAAPTVIDDLRNHTLALQAIIEGVNIGQRRTGKVEDSFVRVGELVDIGLIELQGNNLKLADFLQSDTALVTDHGALTGLGENDHPQYALLSVPYDYYVPQEYYGVHRFVEGLRADYSEIWYDVGPAQLWFYSGTGGVDNKWTDITNYSGNMRFGLSNDAGTFYQTALQINRSGTAFTSIVHGNATDQPDHIWHGWGDFYNGLNARGGYMQMEAFPGESAFNAFYQGNQDYPVDSRWQAWEQEDSTHGRLLISSDNGGTIRNILRWTRSTTTLTDVEYGNTINEPTHTFYGPATFASGYADSVSAGYAGFWFRNSSATADEQWFGIETTLAGTEAAIRITNDASSVYRNVLAWQRTGAAVTGITYANSTDNPLHSFEGYVELNGGGGMDINGPTNWGIYCQDQSAALNEKWYYFESGGGSGTFRLAAANDAFSSLHDILVVNRTGVVIDDITYGNTTDAGTMTHYFKGWVDMAQGASVDGYFQVNAPTAQKIYLGFYSPTNSEDHKYWDLNMSADGDTFNISSWEDTPSVEHVGISFHRTTGLSPALDTITYGNTTDYPVHQFHGATQIHATNPQLRWYESDQVADERYWRMIADGKVLYLSANNDAFSVNSHALRVTRGTGAVLTTMQYGNATDLPVHTFYGDVVTQNGGIQLNESAGNPFLYFNTVTGYTADIAFNYNGTLTGMIRWQPTTNVLEFYDRDPSANLTAQLDMDTGDFQCDGYVWASGEQKNAIVAGNLGSPTMPFSSSSDVDVGITAQSATAGDQVGFYAYMQDGTRQWRCFFGLHDNDAWGMLMTGASIAASTPFKVQVASTSLLEADYQGAVRLYYNNSTKLATQTAGVTVTGEIEMGSGGPKWLTGSGSPESAVTAPVGSLYTDTAGGTGTTLYVKESGTGNTGWVAK